MQWEHRIRFDINIGIVCEEASRVVGCCENGNEHLCSITGENALPGCVIFSQTRRINRTEVSVCSHLATP